MLIRVFADNTLEYGGVLYQCALGRSGIRTDKHEGDGATPTGLYHLKRLYLRADRMTAVETGLPCVIIATDDGWCDDPAHPAYNRPVKLPFSAGHEKMWRDDPLYDLVIEISHNDNPPVPGAGSAVFIHVASDDYAATEGCIALKKSDLVALLTDWSPATTIKISDRNA
ncbi:MAG: L,D-transpeptidase family protein [Rhodospirillales bacterium]